MWKTLVLTIAFVNSAAFRLKELISKNYVSTFWFTTVYKYFKYCTTEEKLFPIQPFHYISFPENFTDSRMESRSSLASQKYPLGNKANSLNPCFFFSICSKCQPYYFFNKRKENHKWFFAIYESLLPNIFGYQCIKDDITYFGSDSSFAQIGTALIAISAKIENIS